jgi:phosphate transport system substrate-binding protein
MLWHGCLSVAACRSSAADSSLTKPCEHVPKTRAQVVPNGKPALACATLRITHMKKLILLALALVVPALASVAGAQSLTGAGASFPKPLYDKLFAEYEKVNGVKVNYQSVGSGAGQRQILAQTVDFGASDAPLTNAQLASAPNKNRVLHIPMALGGVVPIYNIPGVTTQLRFDGETIADIYLGNIKKWNDEAIKKLNPSVSFPDLPITVAYRSDGSGTTSIWVDYLGKVSSEWASKVSKGAQPSVKWPVGVGAPQNAGVANQVKQLPGAIGYVEVIYAKQNKIGYGLVRNSAGRFVDAGDLKTISAAAGGEPLPGDTRVSLTNTKAANGYPIAGFTWILVYKDQKYADRSEAQGKVMVDLLKWMIEDKGGQQYHDSLGYAQIPDVAYERAKSLIASINYGGKGY